jgi:hypothetical protein
LNLFQCKKNKKYGSELKSDFNKKTDQQNILFMAENILYFNRRLHPLSRFAPGTRIANANPIKGGRQWTLIYPNSRK